MTLIHKLDRQTINSIAAGEVVERPASVAKELIDNALDAGASIIRMSMEGGGIKLFSLEDDGSGMSREDALLSVESHTTSKLLRTEDLFTIQTMGFRGEALPSIASVSRLELKTRQREDEAGTRIVIEGGNLVFEGPCGIAPGTAVICRDLFFNTPARYKFLRSDASEAGALADMVGKLALSRPDVSFRLDRLEDGKEILYTPGDSQLLSAIYAVFGHETADCMTEVEGGDSGVRISGYMTGPEGSRHNRSRQIFIVNGRVISSPVLRSAVDEAGKTWFMKGRFPQLVLNLSIPGNLIDVNVHPQKTEMRFWDDRAVFRAVYHTIRAALEGGGRILESVKPSLSPDAQPSAVVLPEQLPLPDIKYGQTLTPSGGEDHIEPTLLFRDKGEDVSQEKKETAPSVSLPPEIAPARSKDIDSLLQARLIGTLLDTYVLLEEGDSLVLIDQHAAHERILYEELLQKRREGERGTPPAQSLIIPVRLSVSESEQAILEEDQDYFHSLGFDYEPFGGDSIALRTVPMTGGSKTATLDPASAFRSALDSLISARQTGREVDESEILHQMACKAAVKARDRLSREEIEILIRRLTDLTNPYHCPHGRPVALRISREELEKRFGRLV